MRTITYCPTERRTPYFTHHILRDGPALKNIMETNKIIGQRLRVIRKGKKITQEELANMLEMDRVSICNIERGVHGLTIDRLIKIAYFLDVEITEIVPKYQDLYLTLPLEGWQGKM